MAGSNESSFADMVLGVQKEIMSTMQGPSTLLENLEAFATAVDWRETWIRGLVGGHVALWLVFGLTRRRHNCQVALFMVIVALVASAERLNTYGREHWEEFATQNYFDERGVFAAVLFCAPLLALSLVMMVNFIIVAANLLIDLKRKQIKKKRA